MTDIDGHPPDDGGLNLLEAPDGYESGETIRVRSTRSELPGPDEVDAYVDDDGIVRQDVNDAAFNANVYEVID